MTTATEMPPSLDVEAGGRAMLPTEGATRAPVHVFDQETIDAVNIALAIERPLLVYGEPGTGKSQLAHAVAVKMSRAFIPFAVDASTETRDLLWTLDTVRRLAEAQIAGTLAPDDARTNLAVLRFVRPGPLWWAFDWTDAAKQARESSSHTPQTPDRWTSDHGVVVLVDEIDKADTSIPNALLDALGHRRFNVDGRDPVRMLRERAPLVVVTTNGERELPDAFVRRCVVLRLGLPTEVEELKKFLKERGRAHYEECTDDVLEAAAAMLVADRASAEEGDLAPPGVAEYIDMLEATLRLRPDDPGAQMKFLDRARKFLFKKHSTDRSR